MNETNGAETTMTEMKTCAVCGAEKPLSAYTKRSGSAGRRGTCRACLRRRKRVAELPGEAGAPAMTSAAAETAAAGPAPARRSPRTAASAGEPAAGAVGAAAASAAAKGAAAEDAAAEDDEAAAKPKRKRRRRRKKPAELRRQDAARDAAEPAAPARADAPADVAEPAAADGGVPAPEAPAAEPGGAAAEQAPPRKRKRKRRRGKAAKRQAGRDAEAPAGAGRRPPNRTIHPVKGNFSFKTSLLNDRGRGMIRLRGRRETGKRWSTEIPTEMAVRMVEEGAAGIIHPGLIHKLYTKADFRILVLQRDDYVCRYCGNYGDTIDHVLPKSKGGLSTPANCVCACAECNLKKADSLDYVDDEALQHYFIQT
ncbi:HNH endonuclease [Paenibacillus sp. GCM10023250]|uniref:HNH endonuclease n=1 Tax=Paenibacillus sp. GCM10023250 TaxID=3252648 RepID=UPI0036073AEC